MTFRSMLHFAKRRAAAAPQKIDGCIGSDPRKPVRCLLFVLELVLVLERLNEGLLSKVLGIRDVPDDAIDLEENPPQMSGNKLILPFLQIQAGLDGVIHCTANNRLHALPT